MEEDEVIEALQTCGRVLDALAVPAASARTSGDEMMQDVLGTMDEGFDEVEDSALVEAGFEALDERERLIVELRFFEGLTQSEIAAQVGISQMHVSRLLRRALQSMRGRLEDSTRGPVS